jgi:hypothetical protein
VQPLQRVAEMPLECVAIKNAAQNHTVSGSLLACMMVPAVTESLPQRRLGSADRNQRTRR